MPNHPKNTKPTWKQLAQLPSFNLYAYLSRYLPLPANPDAILSIPKPDGEDFFVFSVSQDDPIAPATWDLRFSITGTWETAMRTFTFFLKTAKPEGFDVLAFQGQAARDYLRLGFLEELRYRQERQTTKNN